MLTIELLSQIEGLNEDQKTAIAKLSENDENAVIGQKLKTVHDQYDQTFAEVFGISKPASEKSYNFWSQKAKDALDGSKEVKTLRSQVTSLEEKLKSGANDAVLKAENEKLMQQVSDKESVITKLREDVQGLTKMKDEATESAMKDVAGLNYEFAFANAERQIKLRKDLPDSVIEAVKEKAMNKVMGLGKPEFKKEDGKRTITFRDESGNLITNPKNLQNPLTASEAYLAEIADIVDGGKEATGGGGSGKVSEATGYTLLNAKSQREANRAIQQTLHDKGITVSDPKYQTEFNKMHQENNVAQLPEA